MNETLDPTIKNLASAIKKQESGTSSDPYNAKGASGEHGAYQFMPNTWKTWAGTHLGDPNAPMTVENQNKVAYNQIKSWKDKGYNPAQIAAAWNAGEGTLANDKWKTNVGTNTQGVKYDTPNYVKAVSKNYEDLKGKTISQPAFDFGGMEQAQAEGYANQKLPSVSGIVDSIATPFVALGGGVLNTLQQAGLPNAQGPNAPTTQSSYQSPTGNQIETVGYRNGEDLNAYETAKKTAGALAEGSSWFLGGPAFKEATAVGQLGMKPYVLESAKAGGRMLGLSSLGSSMQEGDSLGVSAGKGLLGYGAGYGAGALLGTGAGLLNKYAGYTPELFSKLDNAVRSGDDAAINTIKTSPEFQNFVKANKFDQAAIDKDIATIKTQISEGIDKSYGVSKLTRSEKADALTDDGITAMLEHAANSPNPIYDTKVAIENKANDLMDEALNPIINKVRSEKLPLVPIERNSLINDFSSKLDDTYIPDADKKAINNYVRTLIEEQNKGDVFGVVDAGILRRNANFDFVNPKNKGAVGRILGNVMRDALDTAESKATDPAAREIIAHINAVNKEYSRLMKGVDVVDLMARFPGQKSSELMNKMAGFLSAGNMGGNPLAYYGAHNLTNRLQQAVINNTNKSIFGNISAKAGPLSSSELIGNANRILNNVKNISTGKALTETLAKQTISNEAEKQAAVQRVMDLLPKRAEDLPVIQMGPTPKSKFNVKDKNLPTIRGMAKPEILAGLTALSALGIVGNKAADILTKKYGTDVIINTTPDVSPEVETLASQIAKAETGGEKLPYNTEKWSDRTLGPKSPLGKDLGKYQITSARLKEKAQDFLGQKVTDKEFLASPMLQDKFILAQIKWQLEQGLTPDEVLATHRRGWGNLKPEQIAKAMATTTDYRENAKK